MLLAMVGCSPSLEGDGFYACARGRCPTEYPYCWTGSDNRCHANPEPVADAMPDAVIDAETLDADADARPDSRPDARPDADASAGPGDPCDEDAECGELRCLFGRWGMTDAITGECHNEAAAYLGAYADPCTGSCPAPYVCDGPPGVLACLRPCGEMGLSTCFQNDPERREHCAPAQMGEAPSLCVVECSSTDDTPCPDGTHCRCPPGGTMTPPCDCVPDSW